MKPIHVGALVLLGAIWGASFLFIRVAVHDFGPMPLMFMRVTLGGLVLLAYATFLRQTPDLGSRWRKFLIMGSLNAAIPFVLIAWSELTINASLAAIINSMTPLFTAVIAAFLGNEDLTWQKVSGVMLGIIGVSVLVGGSPMELNQEVIVAVLASVVAALFYGIGANYASRHFTGKHPLHTSIGQLLGASLILLIPAGATIPSATPSTAAIIAMLALVLVSTTFAYMLYFFLLNNVGPTRTVSVTFLVPVFGTIWGIIFLDETFNMSMLLGMAIILTSVGLVIGTRYRKAKVVEA
ncbi:MAG: EamA family transporter [Anaerolineae bacterium]|nr:EamA family transporter [Anaerolineae bacterium]MDQ7034087.1 EamA family transporter [Anaerolineae bacterium]